MPASAFFTRPGNPFVLRSYCKECSYAYNRQRTRDRHKQYRKGDVVRWQDGQLREYNGMGQWKRHWSRQMIDDLRRYFPIMIDEELGGLLGVPVSSMRRKARELHLHKTQEFRKRVNRANLQLAYAESRVHGNRGWIKKGERRSQATEFKPKKKENQQDASNSS